MQEEDSRVRQGRCVGMLGKVRVARFRMKIFGESFERGDFGGRNAGPERWTMVGWKAGTYRCRSLLVPSICLLDVPPDDTKGTNSPPLKRYNQIQVCLIARDMSRMSQSHPKIDRGPEIGAKERPMVAPTKPFQVDISPHLLDARSLANKQSLLGCPPQRPFLNPTWHVRLMRQAPMHVVNARWMPSPKPSETFGRLPPCRRRSP